MKRIRGSLSVIRPEDGIFGAFAVWIGYAVSSGGFLPRRPIPLILVALSTFFLIGALNILNDIRDLSIDRLIHAKRAMASGSISHLHSVVYLIILLSVSSLLAISASILSGRVLIMVIFAAGLTMGLLYEARYKNKGYVGNVIIAVMVSLPLLIGASLGSVSLLVITLCIMAFLTSLGKEIINDVKDMKGDMGFRMTLPAIFGKNRSLLFAVIFLSMAVILSIFPAFFVGFKPAYLLLIGIADLILISVMIISFKGPNLAHRLNSLGMVISLPAFLSLTF